MGGKIVSGQSPLIGISIVYLVIFQYRYTLGSLLLKSQKGGCCQKYHYCRRLNYQLYRTPEPRRIPSFS